MLREVDIRTSAQLGGFGTAGLPHLVFYCCHQSAQGGGEQENINFNMGIKISHIFKHIDVNVGLRFSSKNQKVVSKLIAFQCENIN